MSEGAGAVERAGPRFGGGRIGVLFVNFGEPERATLDEVEPFLERIFLQNAGLEPDQAAVERARQLARDRAPALVREYETIGGSPLNAQARAQAAALADELALRRWDARVYPVFQFTPPFLPDGVAEACRDASDLVVALPVYPLCGTTTTVAALETIRCDLARRERPPRLVSMSGWHHHPAYVTLRAENIRRFVAERGLDLADADTLLYFSVHGTPLRYLDEGSRYDRYVEEHCRDIARRLGADRYGVGFQNHSNRNVAWTSPSNEERIRAASEHRLVVVPISFMHEQSETLAEIDHDLRAYAERLGKELHRVPVPHEAAHFARFLADLTAQLVAGPELGGTLARCRCAPFEATWCTNGARDLPPSPYAGRP